MDSGATYQTPAGAFSTGGAAHPTTPPSHLTPPPAFPTQTPAYPTQPPGAQRSTALPVSTPPMAVDVTGKRPLTPLLIGVGLVLCLLIGGAVSWFGYQAIMASATEKAFQNQVSTGIALTAQARVAAANAAATATADELARKTQAAATASARVEATRVEAEAIYAATQNAQPAALSGPLTWPVVYMADFVSDTGDWFLGREEDDYALIDRSLNNGTFFFEMTAKQGVASRTIPDVPGSVNTNALADFYVAADLVMTGSTTMEGGLLFRYNEDAGYYTFFITREGDYSLWSYDLAAGLWTAVVDYTPSTAISINGINKIEVVWQGGVYHIFVNRVQLVEVTSDLHSGGWVGFIAQLDNAGDHGVWRYDNLVVRAP